MKLTFRTIKQESFDIEVEESMTMEEVKKKIEGVKGAEYPADGQKLIYSGKVLADDSKVGEHKFDTTKFLVVMVSKKPGAPTPDAPAPSTASPAPAADPAPAPVAAAPAQDNLQFAATIETIVGMGYERSQVEAAVRLAFGNAERAVEYLVSGIPDSAAALQEDSEENTGIDGPEAVAPAGQAGGGGGGAGGAGPLDFLRENPQFEQMRQMVRANPQLLQAAIQQMGNANPELLQAITANQEEFIRLMNEDAAPAGAPAPAPGQGMVTIALSESDRAAVLRLRELGFSEAAVVQAFIACERNEEAAANFLFDQADED